MKKLGEILIERGKLTPDQVNVALRDRHDARGMLADVLPDGQLFECQLVRRAVRRRPARQQVVSQGLDW